MEKLRIFSLPHQGCSVSHIATICLGRGEKKAQKTANSHNRKPNERTFHKRRIFTILFMLSFSTFFSLPFSPTLPPPPGSRRLARSVTSQLLLILRRGSIHIHRLCGTRRKELKSMQKTTTQPELFPNPTTRKEKFILAVPVGHAQEKLEKLFG